LREHIVRRAIVLIVLAVAFALSFEIEPAHAVVVPFAAFTAVMSIVSSAAFQFAVELGASAGVTYIALRRRKNDRG
jgi:hypothetical protein